MPRKVKDDTAESIGAEQCPGLSHGWSPRFRGEPHTAVERYEGCWHCGADLGCRRCSGQRDELLCMNASGKKGGKFFGHGGIGPVWASRDSFIKHGLFAGQQLDDYPTGWHALYHATQGQITPMVPMRSLIA